MADSTTAGAETPQRPSSAKYLRGRLTVLTGKVEKTEARLRQAEAIEKERERKRDTRRKIVLGGALLRQATEERPEALAVIERALERLPEREKGLFAGWKPSDPGRGGNNGSKGNDGD